jgi:coenzyme Q-binding protein COQ10
MQQQHLKLPRHYYANIQSLQNSSLTFIPQFLLELTMKTLRFQPLAQSLLRCRPIQPPLLHRRNFLTPPTQTLTASRTLPYPAPEIYSIIADIPQYSSFLPYCTSSSVTAWSNSDKNGKKWPSEAKLVVGWKGFEEAFISKIYCVPGSIVEAVAGRTKTTLPKQELAHYDLDGSHNSSTQEGNGILTHLLTRWTVRPFHYKPSPTQGGAQESTTSEPPKEHTEVGLSIEFQFSNPVYSAMSGAVADRVAGTMIEAFEARVKHVLDGGASLPENGIESVLRKSGQGP